MPVSGVTHPDDRDGHRAALAALADGEPVHRGVTRFIAPGGPMNHYLGGTLTAAFFLAVGIALALPEPSVPEPTVDEPAAD